MGITIDAPGASFIEDDGAKIIADRALYADADMARLLEAGDPDAAWQIASRPGKVVAKHHVEKLGLVMRGDVVVQADDPAPAPDAAPKESEPAGDKATEPKPNKARRIGRRKSNG